MQTVRRLTAQGVYVLLQGRALWPGVRTFSPHDLRRSYVSQLLDAGPDLSLPRQLAGHAQLQTTAWYERQEASTLARPRGGSGRRFDGLLQEEIPAKVGMNQSGRGPVKTARGFEPLKGSGPGEVQAPHPLTTWIRRRTPLLGPGRRSRTGISLIRARCPAVRRVPGSWRPR